MPNPRPINPKNARQSLNGQSYSAPMKKNGHGRFNFGSPEDDVFEYYMSRQEGQLGGNPSTSSLKSTDSKVQVVDADEFEKWASK